MRSIPFTILVLAILVASPARAAEMPLTGPQRPALVVEDGGWDFGRVDHSVELEKTLVLRNRTRRPIIIKEVTQTCGCIQASIDHKEIAGGASAKLVLKLIAARGEGEIKKHVIIRSNDPFQPELKLPMTGHIDPVWWPDLDGHLIDFGKVKNGDTVTKTFRVRVREGFELNKVEALVHPAGGCLSLERTEVKDEDGRRAWDFKLTLGGRMETGSFDGMIRIDTDFAPRPFRGYRIIAEIVSSTEVTPASLNLGRLERGKTWTGRIEVLKTLGDGLTIPSAHCEDPRVKLEKVEVEKGKRFEIKVRIDPGAEAEVLRGEIILVLEEPGQRVVKIPYRGRVID